ncbi:hypothetical protein AGOR_G00203560 [Albula goreensis]|uniref:Uncharacterized protein n=1 Tax=Albula goreensis TaxID=1534307 RepID=A0A8T3CTY5_9TELE|nr:hypothetical protein AGOR_G00203560 [Albula goreensis]
MPGETPVRHLLLLYIFISQARYTERPVNEFGKRHWFLQDEEELHLMALRNEKENERHDTFSHRDGSGNR